MAYFSKFPLSSGLSFYFVWGLIFKPIPNGVTDMTAPGW